jgi:hypothetical protein
VIPWLLLYWTMVCGVQAALALVLGTSQLCIFEAWKAQYEFLSSFLCCSLVMAPSCFLGISLPEL